MRTCTYSRLPIGPRRSKTGKEAHHERIENADTDATQFATRSGGSKTVPTESPAVRAAAIDVKRQLFQIAAEELQVPAAEVVLQNGEIISKADPAKKVTLKQLQALKKRGVIGGITGGIGLAMTEMRVLDRNQTGKVVSRNWHDYKLPTALDVPREVVIVPVDSGDTEANTTGAKGLGEPATIPTAAAIANAVYNAIGLCITKTPMSPVQLSGLLAEREARS